MSTMTEARETVLPRVVEILFWTFVGLGVTLNVLVLVPGVIAGIAYEAWLPIVVGVGSSILFWTVVYGAYWAVRTYARWKAGRDVGEDLTVTDM